MAGSHAYDAVVIGSGPNGLAAAITLARAGRSVLVLEANETVGGCTRSAALTLPGFIHDLGSAIHPLAVGSPFFRTLPLKDYGLSWVEPPAPLAHPFDDGTAALLERSIAATCETLGAGGARQILDALAEHLRALGGEIRTRVRVESIAELPSARAVLCDVTPRQLLRMAGAHLPASYRRKLERYRYGLAAFKVDWALDGPIPWRAQECLRAGTVHLGGTLEEIAASEETAWRGRHAERPFVLLAQPSLFDGTRAPTGKHTVWAYCHVPNGSIFDMTARIENQVERFAPGFRARVLARHVMSPAELERKNANLVGGDINGGAQDIRQLFTRPTLRLYSTPTKGLYICSSSTPPGGGVHGLCGYFAAQRVLRSDLL